MSNVICEICDSSHLVTKYHGQSYLCSKHRSQMDKHGHILSRTYRDRNVIEIKNDHAEIILMDKECDERARALISLNKILVASPYKWSLNKKGYAIAKINNKMISLHKFLKRVTMGHVVDHINRNKLDCRDENLREVTYSQNSHNSKINTRNKSGIKGIRQNIKTGKWSAEIRVNGNRYRKSGLNTKEDAIKQLEQFKRNIED